MMPARGRAFLLLIAILVGAMALIVTLNRLAPLPERAPVERPRLLLLTSLPLLFSEDFSLQGSGWKGMRRLRERYEIIPISTSSANELAKGRLLLMAQPRAQPPDNLVALDDWVRRGGRVLLLADPMLEWPSTKPLGDLTRPPIMFADTGLLAHWGLTLDTPERRGLIQLGGGHDPVAFVSPGRLVARHSNCALSWAGIVAECNIGQGRAVIVADADFLNPAIAALRPAIDNSNELMDLLDWVER